MKTTMIFGALVVGLSLAPNISQAAGWTLLGAREVTDRVDHDEIALSGHWRFNHIKICVYRHPVHFYDARVTYQNGEHQDLSISSNIARGRCTRDIDLAGGERDIANIRFAYEATGWGWHDATVRVYGR